MSQLIIFKMRFSFTFCLYCLVLLYLNIHGFEAVCQSYREDKSLIVLDLVGTWITVYIQPSSVDCFILQIRATTELERDSCFLKYGNFQGRVDWSKCLLEIESPLGKHYLQGTGNQSGLLENVIITETVEGKYELHEQNADQWSMFGRRGTELLLMTDCHGGAVAIFARAHYWPAPEDFYAILHRAGITPLTIGKVLCEPLDSNAQKLLQQYFSKRMSRGVSQYIVAMACYGALIALAMFLCVTDFVWSEQNDNEHEEMKLHTDILKDYNSNMRPVKDHKSAVTVKVRLALKYLSFDSSEEMITVHSWVALNWNDAFLTWKPSDYSNINEIQIESHEIWTPGMALFNADASGYNSDSFYTTCLVTNTGKVTCVPHLAHTGICRTTLRKWPYDVQNCTLYFGSWMHTGEQINFTFYNVKPVVLDDFQNGAGWKLLNVLNDRLPGKYNFNSTYPMLKYTFMLRREAAGLAAIVVAPSVILVLVTLASLLLDVKDNTRLILLCFSLFGHFTMTSEIGYVIPKLSSNTPIILLFVRDSMIVTLTSILVTMALMALRKQVVPAPAWIMSLNRLVSIGPGKYIVFTEFDPSDAAEGKIVTENSRSEEEKNARAASDWIKFANFLNTLTFVILLFVYLVLICTCIPSDT